MNSIDLSKIIKKVDNTKTKSSDDTRLIEIDPETGKQVQANRNLIQKLLNRNNLFYLVKNDSDPRNACRINEITYPIDDFEQNIKIELILDVEVSVIEKSESIFAEACFEHESAETLILKSINKWLSHFYKDMGIKTIVTDFDNSIDKLNKHINEQAKKIGLNIKSKIRLVPNCEQIKIKIPSQKVTIGCKECTKTFKGEISIDVQLDPENEVRYITQFESKEDLIKEIIEHIEANAKESLSIIDYYQENYTAIKTLIDKTTTSIIEKYGFKITNSSFSLTTKLASADLTQQKFSKKHSNKFGGSTQFDYVVDLRFNYKIDRENIIKFYISDMDSTKRWLDTKVNDCIAEIIDLSNIEDLIDQGNLNNTFDSELSNFCSEVGIKVDNFHLNFNILEINKIENQLINSLVHIEFANDIIIPIKIKLRADLKFSSFHLFYKAGLPTLNSVIEKSVTEFFEASIDTDEESGLGQFLEQYKELMHNLAEDILDKLETIGIASKNIKCQPDLTDEKLIPEDISCEFQLPIQPRNQDRNYPFEITIKSGLFNRIDTFLNPINFETFKAEITTALNNQLNEQYNLYTLLFDREISIQPIVEKLVSEKLTVHGRKLLNMDISVNFDKNKFDYSNYLLKETFSKTFAQFSSMKIDVTIEIYAAASKIKLQNYIKQNMPNLSNWFKGDVINKIELILAGKSIKELQQEEHIKQELINLFQQEEEHVGINAQLSSFKIEFPLAKQYKKLAENFVHRQTFTNNQNKEFSIKLFAELEDYEMFYSAIEYDVLKQIKSVVIEKLELSFTGTDYVTAVSEYSNKIKKVEEEIKDTIKQLGYKDIKPVFECPFNETEMTQDDLSLKTYGLQITANDYKEAQYVVVDIQSKTSNLRDAINNKVSYQDFKTEVVNQLNHIIKGSFSLYEIWYQTNGKIKNLMQEKLQPLYEKYGRTIELIKLDANDEPHLFATETEFCRGSLEATYGDSELVITVNYKTNALILAANVANYLKSKQPNTALIIQQVLSSKINSLLEEVEIHMLTTPTKLEGKLIETVTEEIAQSGITLSNFNLKIAIPEKEKLYDKTFEYTIKEEIETPTTDGHKIIHFNNKVTMQVVDFNSYYLKGCKKPETLIEEIIHKVFHRLFFELDYANIVLNYKNFEKDIKEDVRIMAYDYGYQVNQIIIDPRLEPLTWQEQFRVDMEGYFSTKRGSEVPVKVVLFASIDDLASVRDYLDKKLMKEICKVMSDAVNAEMIKTELSSFYMAFDTEISPNLQLFIKEKLITKFPSISIDSVTPQMHRTEDENDVLNRQEALIKEKGRIIPVKFAPLAGGFKHEFSLLYVIKGVFLGLPLASNSNVTDTLTQQSSATTAMQQYDQSLITNTIEMTQYWDIFYDKRSEFDSNDVERSVTQYVIDELKQYDQEQLESQNPNDLKPELNTAVNMNIADEYGISIQILSISRERTELEDIRQKLESEKIKAAEAIQLKSMKLEVERANFELEKLELDNTTFKENYTIVKNQHAALINNITEKQSEIVDSSDDCEDLKEELNLLIEQKNKVKEQLDAFATRSNPKLLKDTHQRLLSSPSQNKEVNEE